MAAISIQEARNKYTNAFIGTWKETFPVTNFMRSWFEDKISPTKTVSIEVQRGTKTIAVDVMRGEQAQRNKGSLSTQKIFDVPYFFEGFDNTELSLYDALFGSYNTSTDSDLVKAAVMEVTEKYKEIKAKIERAYELNCAKVLQTGKVTTSAQDEIDYKAKGSHIATLSTKWDNATPKIFESIKNICDVLRTDGASAVEFDVIMGASAAQKLLDSTEYATKFALNPVTAGQYNLPRAEVTSGAIFHNRVSAGPYIINLWAYNDSYTNGSGVDTPFLDPKKVIVLAKSFKGIQAFAAVPRVLTASNQFSQMMESGKYILNNYVDQRTSVHYFDCKSAGLPVPVTIDHFACLTVLA